MRYFRLYGAFLRNCLRQAVEFRANFWANLLTNIGWMLTLVIFINIIFLNTTSVDGWTKPEMLVLFGTYSALRGVSNTLFYSNLSQLPTFIRMGTMDFILTKPVNAQFYTSLRFISLEDLGQTIGAFAVIAYGWSLYPGHHVPSLAAFAVFGLLLLCGLAMFYSITLLMMTASFWLVRLDNLMVLGDTVFSIARTPISIFRALGPVGPFLFQYVLPLAFLAAVPVQALFGRINAAHALLNAGALAAVFVALSSAYWRFAVRSYSSASS